MKSLREEFVAAKSKEEFAAASLREKLSAEALQAEQNAKVQQLRSHITLREGQKRTLDEAVAAVEGGYATRAGNIESLKQKGGSVKTSETAFSQANAVIEALQEEFSQALLAKGVESKEQLLNAPDFSEYQEVLGYKRAETETTQALKSKSDAVKPVRESAAALRAAKAKVIEVTPDLGLPEEAQSFSNKNKENTLEKLRQYSVAIGQEIETLKLQTPEGQKAAKEQLGGRFEERFKNLKLFTLGSPGYSVGLVKPEDIVDAEKYGEPMVQGTLREQAAAKLKNEVDKEKEKLGIPEARQDLEALKQLPDKYEALVGRVQRLAQKRENIIIELGKKEADLGVRVRCYFGRDTDRDVGALLEKDFAGAWLLYNEKTLFFKELYGNYWRNEDVARKGVPAILSEFLEKRRETVRMLGQQGRMGGDRARLHQNDLPDLNSLEADIEKYETFLDVFDDIVRNHPESVALGHTGSSSTNKSDFDILQDNRASFQISNGQTLRQFKLKSGTVVTDIDAGKSFREIETGIKGLEAPFDAATAERAEFLTRLIDKEWSEQELSAFVGKYRSAPQLEDKAKKIEARKIAGRELSSLLSGTERLVSSGEPHAYDKVMFRLRNQEGHIYLTITQLDSESLREKAEKAEKEFERVKAEIVANKGKKRPWKLYGKPQLDLELQALQTEEEIKKGEFQVADNASKANIALRDGLVNSLSSMAGALKKGFDVKNDVTFPLDGFLATMRKMIDEAYSASLTPPESAILEQFSQLQQIARDKKDYLARAQGDINNKTLEKLREAGWRETR